MATDFDNDWMSVTGCASPSACNNTILSLLNRTAVFYEQQLGLTLDIARQYGPTAHSSTTVASELLYDFRAYNTTHRSSVIHDGQNTGDNLVDLFQFFTGRTMDQQVVGIAFTGVMCDNFSSAAANMVVSHKSNAADPVITAHELGHTLNAHHTTSGIMAATLGGSLPTRFSSVSVDEMLSYYSTYKQDCRGGARKGTSPPSSLPDDTPTPDPSPGDDSPTSVPQTLQLRITQSGVDSYVIKTTVSTVLRGCFVSIRAGTSKQSAKSGTVLTRYNPLTSTTTQRGRVAARVAASDPKNATVYLRADYKCGGSQLIETSPTVSITPIKGANRAHLVSRRSWINLLNKAF